jgi:putative two-component system response regulator
MGLGEPQTTRVLVVDDEQPVIHVLRRLLLRHGYVCDAATSAEEARVKLARAPGFHLMLCDVTMPGESGLDLVRDMARVSPDTAIVMVTGIDDPAMAEVALESGVYGYVIKPFEANEILINIRNALRRRALEVENREQKERLARTLDERTFELRDAISGLRLLTDDLRNAYEETIQRLARAAEFRHNETAQHVQRMSRYSAMLSRKLGLSEERCELIRVATPLHDVGKIGIPDAILLKPGPLDAVEVAVMRRHTTIGYRILSGSHSELLNLAADIARTHHEHWDGTGYPDGLAGAEIPIEGRIAAVADVFDALTTRRVYRDGLPVADAIDIMVAGRGTHFDPDLLDLFFAELDEALAIREVWADGR